MLRPARNSRADSPRHANADVFGMQHAEGCLAEGLGDGQLIHLFVVALLQVDDLALRRAADQDHRPAIGGGIGQRRQTIEEARSRHRHADARLLRQKAGDRSGISGVLLVSERNDPHAFSLCHTEQIRDRDAGHVVDRVDPVELERVNDEVETVRQRMLLRVVHFRDLHAASGSVPLLHCHRVHGPVASHQGFVED